MIIYKIKFLPYQKLIIYCLFTFYLFYSHQLTYDTVMSYFFLTGMPSNHDLLKVKKKNQEDGTITFSHTNKKWRTFD